jgi:hypothetical protein
MKNVYTGTILCALLCGTLFVSTKVIATGPSTARDRASRKRQLHRFDSNPPQEVLLEEEIEATERREAAELGRELERRLRRERHAAAAERRILAEEERWECPVCNRVNTHDHGVCEVCLGVRPEVPVPEAAPATEPIQRERCRTCDSRIRPSEMFPRGSDATYRNQSKDEPAIKSKLPVSENELEDAWKKVKKKF